MMRFLAFLGALLLGLAAAQAAPIDNKDGFWSDWSDATFERAAAEKKFVIVSLQSWWCPWCHAMNRDTWANPDVRAVLKDHFIPVAVDQDSRPDISQRYERWGWPATIIFGPDGTEIVKLRGFYSPKFFIPILQETIRDPSPVDYGKFGGPERERTLATGLSDSERAEILAFIDKAYDRANGGWSKSKLVDGPTLGWFLDRAKAGDKEAEARIRRSLTAQIALMDKESGGISQVSLKPDWSQPSLEFPMFAQQAALVGLCPRRRAVRRPDLPRGGRPHLRLPQEHARRTGRRLLCLDGHGRRPARRRQAPVCPRDRPGDPGTPRLLRLDRREERAGARRDGRGLGDCASAACRAAASATPSATRAGPTSPTMSRWAQPCWRCIARQASANGSPPPAATGDFIARTFIDPKTGGFLASAAPDARHLPKPIKQREDNVTATRFFTLLAAYTGNARDREIAEAGMGYLASPPVLDAYGFLPDVLLAEAELKNEPVHVTIVGPKDDPRSAALYAAALRYPLADKRAEWWDKREGQLVHHDVDYPDFPDGPAAFACTRNFCSLPVTDPAAIPEQLDRLQRAIEK